MSSSSSSGGPMGSKKAIQNGGNMEQHIIDGEMVRLARNIG